MSTRARLVFASLIALSGAAALAACILADPPPLQSIPPPTVPQILADSVSPPLGQAITSASGQSLTFSLAVQTDTNQPLEWRVFIDPDPNADPTRVGFSLQGGQDGGVLATSPDASSIALVPVDFTLNSQLDFSKCHKIKLIVATGFEEFLPAIPLPPGGDSVTWSYEPVADCDYFDAAPPFDASTQDDGADE